MRKHLAITAAAGAAALIGGAIMVSVARAGDDDRSGDRMGFYKQTNLVADKAGLGAPTTDPNLVNPWGMAWAPGGAAWVANNGTGTSTLYTGKGVRFPPGNPLVVKIPGIPPNQGTPTGMVWNANPGQFQFHDSEDKDHPSSKVGAAFIFAGEDGIISAWSPSLKDTTKAVVVVPASKQAAVYKGLAFGTNGRNFIFATNFATGEIDVYDSNFTEVSNNGKHGKMFHDPQMPKDYAPFGIQNINNDLFVTFAKRSADKPREEEQAGAGFGIVDVFSTDGDLLQRFASHGPLNAPWGVTLATKGFGKFSGAVLIGNFGNGQINAFDYRSGRLLGALQRPDGTVLAIEGLWSLAFGNFLDADSDELYFTAGINDEEDGLFGEIAPVSGKKD
jgi:uncharacterized protein (TIGR03118 family)